MLRTCTMLMLTVTLLTTPLLAAEPETVAVLELENQSKTVTDEEVQFITDMVRKAARDGLDPAKYVVMTRETMEVLVPPSDMQCLAGKCLVEIGKKLQAKYVVGGSVKDFGTEFAITLEAYESKTGMLTGSETGTAATVKEAVPLVQQMAGRLIGRIKGEAPAPPPLPVVQPQAQPPAQPPAQAPAQPLSQPSPPPAAGPSFQVTGLPAVPTMAGVTPFDPKSTGLDLGNLDVGALEKYDRATRMDKGTSTPEDKAKAWRDLADTASQFTPMATKRAEEWERFAAQLRGADEARRLRVAARDKDWARLSRLLPLDVVSTEEKRRWAKVFVEAYGTKSAENPYAVRLAVYLPKGTVEEIIDWVDVPGGTFTMGANDGAFNEKPAHPVTMQPFQMAKTETTVRQYRACVEQSACDGARGEQAGDDHPVVAVDWTQSKAFCKWAAGRLCSEAEWEYAARNGSAGNLYPWGNDDATCSVAVLSKCAAKSAAVCSKEAGNNEWGVCDLVGNVKEWLEDRSHGSYGGAPADGSAWEEEERGQWGFRVTRGDGFSKNGLDRFVRASTRASADPSTPTHETGLRCCRSIPR